MAKKKAKQSSTSTPKVQILIIFCFGAIVGLGTAQFLPPLGSQKSAHQASKGKPLNLMEEARKGKVDTIKSVLASGFDPNTVLDDKGTTLMLVAAKHGKIKLVEHLLSAGADPNQADHSGMIPMRIAAVSNHPQVVRVIMMHQKKNK